MEPKTTFLSYSRRQLYFAESLALHLQKGGLDVWFDLQQLQAGKVWFCAACSVVNVACFAIPFWRRSIAYKQLKRGVFWSLLLSLLLMFSIKTVPLLRVPLSFLAVMCFVTLFVYIWSIRRSATLLRWMQLSWAGSGRAK